MDLVKSWRGKEKENGKIRSLFPEVGGYQWSLDGEWGGGPASLSP